jgi:hypothetical protein
VLLLDCEQGSPEWLAARRGIPTASNFDMIITAKTGKYSTSADDYAAMLIDEIVRPDEQEGFGGNRHTERGKLLEPQARNYYRFLTGYTVTECGLCLREDGKAGCSPDSLVEDNGKLGGLEIKAPDGKKHVAWMRAKVLPEEHKQQVHGSMVITDTDWWDFLSFCPGYKPFRVRTFRDGYTDLVEVSLDRFIRELEAAKAEFIDYIPERMAA